MARGNHPAPRLSVHERIVLLDCLPKMVERCVVVASPVFELAVKHGCCNLENIYNAVGEVKSGGRYSLRSLLVKRPLLLGCLNVAGRRVGNPLAA